MNFVPFVAFMRSLIESDMSVNDDRFSIYLTFLEPFVIGATCLWCLSSAVIMTLLYLLTTRKLSPEPELVDPDITNA